MPINAMHDDHATEASAAARRELVERLARLAPGDGVHATSVTPLSVFRASGPTQPLPTVYEPSVCFVAQGRKTAQLNGDAFAYDALNYLVVSVTLPVCGQVVEATPERPFLSLRLDIDPAEVGALVLEAAPLPVPGPADRGLYVARMTGDLFDAVLRLVRLVDAPRDRAVLAPMVMREICYRVLQGELGHRLREAAAADGRGQRITRAIAMIKQRYTQPLRMAELAAAMHMSTSALHHHFKAVTAMSPLQFQKQLRLHEARRLMLIAGIDATVAAHQVGYESPSQFSREYKRLFGAPPRQEIAALRGSGVTATPS